MPIENRLHALDNLRAIMMWLGIVLHVSLNHVVGESPSPWRDPKTTLIADFLIAFIHAFRMPVFFVLAGFFVSMLIGQRGYGGMLEHRLRRLALPFAIFWPVIYPLTVVLLTVFVHQMVRGTLGLDLSLLPKPPNGSVFNTIHLWFIYLLMWFCVFTAVLAWGARFLSKVFLRPNLITLVRQALQNLTTHWWGFLMLAIPLAFAGESYKAGLVIASGLFIPPLAEWVHSGLFFIVGLALYERRQTCLDYFSKFCWRFASAGFLSFFAWIVVYEANLANPALLAYPQLLMAFAYGCTSWLWSLALIGGFVRYRSRPSAGLQYLADSSYWAYLVHMLGTIGFGALLCNLPLGALTKMGINMAVTTLFCLVTYQFFVRRRFIGRLLNGQGSAAR